MLKRKNTIRIINLILVTAFLLTCVGIKEGFISVDEVFGVPITTQAFSNNKVMSYSSEDLQNFELLLIDKNHIVPGNYKFNTVKLSNGEEVHEGIYPDLQNMFDDARSEGVYPTVNSGFRSFERQTDLYNNKYEGLIKAGYSKSDALKETENWIAAPGTSEHQLGIAVDIKADKNKSDNSDVYAWLENNAHKYGFILRYPEDKYHITGINYEPWHYRYVGIDAATEIYEKGITLEEFLMK